MARWGGRVVFKKVGGDEKVTGCAFASLILKMLPCPVRWMASSTELATKA